MSDLNFENWFGIRIKLWIESCSSNFKNQKCVLFMLGAIIGTIIIALLIIDDLIMKDSEIYIV